MAEAGAKISTAKRQPSRLQRRAPASIKINPVKEWNVAIPLLSPLVQSPTTSEIPIFDVRSYANGGKDAAIAEKQSSVVMKMWQHPAAAAPFIFETETPFLPFVCTGNLDR